MRELPKMTACYPVTDEELAAFGIIRQVFNPPPVELVWLPDIGEVGPLFDDEEDEQEVGENVRPV